MFTADGTQCSSFQRRRVFVDLPARVLHCVVRVLRLGLQMFLDVLVKRSAECQFASPLEWRRAFVVFGLPLGSVGVVFGRLGPCLLYGQIRILPDRSPRGI